MSVLIYMLTGLFVYQFLNNIRNIIVIKSFHFGCFMYKKL